ncbi:hypothetical protein KIN20_004596 [Parelaphostrongylus tenuis]|uniref:Uncharacterized protein n=1 Tax=Parelaphostrongylus tenuis TaxID=148309 RepID=A0AAD5LZ21_PARTN|nr:hypothetical protein KIN20_004596 [Parelaphostrongylus tenuis]
MPPPTLPRSASQTLSQHNGDAKVSKEDGNHCTERSDCLHRPSALPPSQSFPSNQHPPLHSLPSTCHFPVPASNFPNASGPPMTIPWSYVQPIPISFVPPGTVPIPIQDINMSIAEGKPICPVSVAEQLAQMNSNNICWASMAPNTVPVAIPIPTPVTIQNAPVDPSQEPRISPTSVPPRKSSIHKDTFVSLCDTSASTSDDSVRVPLISNVAKQERDQRRSAAGYDEQIAEKKRIEAEEAERDRYEEEKIMREREAQIRREEEEQRRHLEAEHLREQEKERVRKALEEALERAKHEAEITRKAKVYRHVLEGAEKSPELERRLLGVDPATGDRILQEINQLERHKKLDREAIDKMSPKVAETDEHGKSSDERRSRNVHGRSRQSSNSEAEVFLMVGDVRRKTPPKRKQTPTLRPLNSSDVHSDSHSTKRANDFSGAHRISAPNNASTPFRRTDMGRMSVRVTRKEKENSTVDNFKECSAEAANRSSTDCVLSPQLTRRRDHNRIPPPSKIPIATIPSSGATVVCDRPSTLSCRPLKSVNHYYHCRRTVESEAVQLIKSLPEDIPSPRRPVSSEGFCDNPLFSPVVTRTRRPNRMRGTTNSPLSVESTDSSNGSTEGASVGSSSESSSPQASAPSPVPSIVVSHDPFTVTKSIPTLNNNELKIRRAVASPASYLNETPRPASRFSKRLAEKGCKQAEDLLSVEVRRKAEADLSRASSMHSIRGSVGNLSVGWQGSVSNLTEESPFLSRFRSTDPKFRSMNTRKTTEKQREVINRLTRLRESLRSKESFVERDPPSKLQNDINDIATGIKSITIVSNS